MARVNLRQLSRQFARGTIDRAEYRRRRSELIESILTFHEGDAQPTGPNTDTPFDKGASSTTGRDHH